MWLAEDLDEVTRERYIAQAMAEHGLEYRRRRSGILPLPIAAGMDAIRHHRGASSAAALTVVAASGIALAVIHDNYQPHTRPPGAAPASRWPAPTNSAPPQRPRPHPPQHPKPAADTPTAQSTPTATTSLLSTEPAAIRTPRLPIPTRLPIQLPSPRLSVRPGVPPVLPTLRPPSPPAVQPVCVIRVNAAGIRVRVCQRA